MCKALSLMSLIRCYHPTVASLVFFSSSLSLSFFWHFWSGFLNKMLAKKPKGQEVKTQDDFHCFIPTHFLLLIKRFFYLFILQKFLMGGQTNMVYLPLFFLIFDFCFNILENHLQFSILFLFDHSYVEGLLFGMHRRGV